MMHDPMHPIEPEQLRSAARCGAKTRAGKRCRSPAVAGCVNGPARSSCKAFLNSRPGRLAVLSARHGIPKMSPLREYPAAGGRPEETRRALMTRKVQYGVQFVGYLAQVIARKYGREVEYTTDL
jgi:hypothetical protein